MRRNAHRSDFRPRSRARDIVLIGALGLASATCSDGSHVRESTGVASSARASASPEPASNAGAAPSWIDVVQARLAASEYAAHVAGDGVMRATNRAQGLRATFDARGIELAAREHGDGVRVRIGVSGATAGFGEGACRADGAVDERGACLRRAERAVAEGAAIEWWENRADGLEHGVTFARRPGDARDALAVVVAIDGASVDVDADGQGASFAMGGRRMRYAQLSVRDVDGRVLPATMRGAAGGLEIRVDDRNAHYPVTVDPLLTTVAWSTESNQASALLGSSVASAGDVNGDGYGDVIVGAPRFSGGVMYSGRALLYLGGPMGLATASSWSAEGGQVGGLFGFSVASAGDVNGDGFGDVIIGAYSCSRGEMNEGCAFVYLGSATGLSSAIAWTGESNQAGAEYGISVSSAGDVNGDGFGDVIVGARRFNNRGRAYVYLGAASGLGGAAAWTVDGTGSLPSFGFSVGTAGDVDGDGFDDVIVGAYNDGSTTAGAAYLYRGSPSGPRTTADWSAEGSGSYQQFGVSVAGAGDVNGDGYADIIVGSNSFTNGQSNEGKAVVYLGSATGLGTSAAWTVESNSANAQLGYSVASAGDVNGDGFADVIVGAYNYTNGQTGEGRTYVFLGGSSGLATTAAWTTESDQMNAFYGITTATAGDVNGDGFGDVIVGAPNFDNGHTDEGRAYLYLGSPSGLASASGWSAESNQPNAAFGISARSAGDVNGDGFDDVIVGAELFDNGESDEGRAFLYLGTASGLSAAAAWTAEGNQASAQFGHAVASAGDVNGDGFDDVIVGANFFDNGQFNEGRAFVYLGSATGLGAMPAWFAEADQSGARFGDSVATAGDVNGDGYSDVIVGATLFDNVETNEGRAFLYLGSATGLASTPAWTGESDQANAQYGGSVASAQDVNGDGFDDVIVGAQYFDNPESDEGRAYVYLGSAAGLSSAAGWTAEGNASTATFGSSVAAAGDVNGDGFGDVVVGASSILNEGRAYVFFGGSGGLASAASWSAGPVPSQTSSAFGIAVASAGDVNGDGYGDVLVGAQYFDNPEANEGRAFLFVGSASGLGTSPAWTADSNQVGAQLGLSVASAGDVNGDGYSDVVVGAPAFDNDETDEGRVFVYFGNGGDGTGIGVPLRPQLRAPGTISPVAPRNRVAGTSVDVAAISARSPTGRTRARIEFEIRPLGTPFTGTSLTRSATWIDTNALGTSIAGTAAGLVGSTAYHWRARLVYDPTRTATWQHSRWLYGGLGGEPRGVHFRTVDLCAGVTCTASDACHVAGVCNPATGSCSDPVAGDGTNCDDGNACTRSDSCRAGACVGANPTVCTPSDACHDAGVCDPTTGVCSNPTAPDGTVCDDGNACTQIDACATGTCTGTNPLICTASDACHVAGICDPGTGACSNPTAANGTVCSDGNACTQGDTCLAGACVGSPVTCVASDACHLAGVCDPATGACTNPTAADGTGCTDGNGCTQSDTCQSGACVGANPVTCVASDACHVAGICDPSTGTCTNPVSPNGTPCSDGNACTQADTCQIGACVGANPVICVAADACHSTVCDTTSGACTNQAVADGTACDDGDACTQVDSCTAGTCSGSNPVTCVASDVCHLAGVCDPSTGACTHPAVADGSPCDDGIACTTRDVCAAGACVGMPVCFDAGSADVDEAGADGSSVDTGIDAEQTDAAVGDGSSIDASDVPSGDVPIANDGPPASDATSSRDASTDATSDGPDAGTAPNRGACACATPGQTRANGLAPVAFFAAAVSAVFARRRRYARRGTRRSD